MLPGSPRIRSLRLQAFHEERETFRAGDRELERAIGPRVRHGRAVDFPGEAIFVSIRRPNTTR